MHIVWQILVGLSAIVIITWLGISMFLYLTSGWKPNPFKITKSTWSKLNPLYWPSVVVLVIHEDSHYSIWDIISIVCMMACWYLFKNADKEKKIINN